MAGKDELFCYETKDFWMQVKNAGYEYFDLMHIIRHIHIHTHKLTR